MHSRIAVVASTLISVAMLTGCAPTSPETTSFIKEAGYLGSRICFINATGLPMSAGFSGTVFEENASHIVGTGGMVSGDTERCFAGWNSFLTKELRPRDYEGSGLMDAKQDVVAAVNIDGRYNVAIFRARNMSWDASMYWTDNVDKEQAWNGKLEMHLKDSYSGSVKGHDFTVTRRDDSEFYKEFVVRFSS